MGSDLSQDQWKQALDAGWVDDRDTRIRELEAEVARLKERVAWEMQRGKALEDALAKGGGDDR